jgi:hypothetical protein
MRLFLKKYINNLYNIWYDFFKKGVLNMEKVIVESPYAGNVTFNEMYGEFCLHDCLVNYNESPYASHLLYTRPNVLRDHIPSDRKIGIEAGFCWRDVADKTVFYTDMGITDGMKLGIKDCKEKGKPYEVRKLPDDLMEKFLDQWSMLLEL